MKRLPITMILVAVLGLSGCASIKTAYQNMTPAQKAKYAINGVFVVAQEGINIARLFMNNSEDADAIQAKLATIKAQIESSVNVILALIPPGMDGVSEYAQDRIDELNADVNALQGDFPPLEPLVPD
ncbi:hypothetical protein LCGC14_1177840 [marine sediment metagenome]|uniref:Lipoprotein n=1 Tax=marine sediment metagenome TaxID=412755 RepID=A0A0F9LSX1_9ZZZZ